MGASYALVYVSLFEGFGIPIVEAMQSGVPVITSNGTSMPEVAGDAAICVNPDSTAEICHAMKTIIVDKNLYKLLKEKGLQRCKLFTWQRTADLIWQSIEKTIETKYTKNM
jgi:glycosyltransferase involved in cell wall biosynthesis